jgi:hypothetical protein
MEFEGHVGARDGTPWFWIREGEPEAGVHAAFTAAYTGTVDAVYAATIGASGEDDGGVRPTPNRRNSPRSRLC